MTRGFDRTRLAVLREKRGLTRGDLARMAGVSTTTIDRWENGARGPQVNTLIGVAKALGVEIGDLILVPRGERYIGDWRVLLGITQPELGRRTGIETSKISRIERGEADLTDDVAAILGDALGVAPEELRECYERARTRPPGASI